MRFAEKIKKLLSISNNSNTPKNKDDLRSGVRVFDSTDENVFYLRGTLRKMFQERVGDPLLKGELRN